MGCWHNRDLGHYRQDVYREHKIVLAALGKYTQDSDFHNHDCRSMTPVSSHKCGSFCKWFLSRNIFIVCLSTADPSATFVILKEFALCCWIYLSEAHTWVRLRKLQVQSSSKSWGETIFQSENGDKFTGSYANADPNWCLKILYCILKPANLKHIT